MCLVLPRPDVRLALLRKGDAVVKVIDATGNPVRGAKISIEQTRHAFLFGSNIYCWGAMPSPALEKAYRDRFAALLNYATLPFYWWSYERRQGEPDHARTEEIAQ